MIRLKKILGDIIPAEREKLRNLLREHGEKNADCITIGQLAGGLRNVRSLLCDTSSLDPMKGIRFRGYDIPSVLSGLPSDRSGNMPYPIGIWHLLLTGQIPETADVEELNAEIRRRQQLPHYVIDVLRALPSESHPMTMLSAAVLAMQRDSLFVQAYNSGVNREAYWSSTFEDSLTLLARLPLIAAYIYRRKYKGDTHFFSDPELDWGFNFAHILGIDEPEYQNLMRLYLLIHCDHEGGNVSNHTAVLVSSALSDVFYSVSAGLNGLAGPLHGLANQECLSWIKDLMSYFRGTPTPEQVAQYTWDTLNSGKVIPGYGHAVLRNTDPRFLAMQAFGLEHFPDDPLFHTVNTVFAVVPGILAEHGHAKNPWPNVDAISGSVQYHYGVTEYDFYTVLFGVSRAMGMTAQIILARGYGSPIERPKSCTVEELEEIARGALAPRSAVTTAAPAPPSSGGPRRKTPKKAP